MRSWSSPDVYRPIPKNIRFYDGPSLLTGDPILAIASAQNGNRKIGHMLQLWIMLRDVSPIEAVKTGLDAAVCGDCPLRGHDGGEERACYVEWWRSVENIWQARDKAVRLKPEEFAQVVTGLQLRVGAYGDPAAVPHAVWLPLVATAAGWTAYTHQWHRADPALRAWCMASVDDPDEQRAAAKAGWRTYRTRATADAPVRVDEVICPASDEGGHKTVCATCELCRGTSRPAKHVVIVAHGTRAKWFTSRAAAAPASV